MQTNEPSHTNSFSLPSEGLGEALKTRSWTIKNPPPPEGLGEAPTNSKAKNTSN